MTHKTATAIALAACLLSGSRMDATAAPNAPTRLTCEYVANPLGIDNPSPLFGWASSHPDRGQTQKGYQIIVASNRAGVDANSGDVWSKQADASSQQVGIQYAGSTLSSKTKYWWKVRVFDKTGAASPFSEAATFETAMLSAADWGGAQWIGGDFTRIRKEFTIDNAKTIAQARAYVVGHGYYELRINGQKVGDHVLDPGYTDYVFRALYSTYDITSILKPGANAVGIMLGNAYYTTWEMQPAANKKAILHIAVRFTDNSSMTIVSDLTWKGKLSGPVVSNSVYDGEVYDARLEDAWDQGGYTETGWSSVSAKTPPVILTAQLQAIKVTDILKPVSMNGGVFNLGQNIAGWARLSVAGTAGSTIRITHCELAPGTGETEKTDTYTFKGSGVETWEPRFTYHGFQYIKVTGGPALTTNDIKGCVVRSAVDSTGSFSCSAPLLNKIHNSYVWTQKNNIPSIPTDCPQRDERKGWTGDALVTSEAACFNLDMKVFYAKWFNDMRDFQIYRSKNGAIANINPCPEAEKDPAGWATEDVPYGSAAVSIPWDVYMAYGDKTLLEKSYPMMKGFVDYVTSISPGNICSSNRWSDWGGSATDAAMLSTGYYFRSADLLAKAAQELGKTADAATYSQLANSIRTVFNTRWLKNGDHYNNNEQAANALALSLELVPPANKAAVLGNLTSGISSNGNHLTTGVLGSCLVMNALWQNEASDAGYALANQTTQPSWGYMVNQGATTIWEFWDGRGSRNHPMMGGPIDAWFYKAILGIYPTKPGYEELAIRPQIGGNLTNAKGSVMTVRGLASSEWARNGNDLTLTVNIPFNSRAVVSVPKPSTGVTTIYEGATLVWQGANLLAKTAGIDTASEDAKYVNFLMGSGLYRFGYTPGAGTAVGVQPAALKEMKFTHSPQGTRFLFILTRKEFVELRIVDMRGRVVATPLRGRLGAGSHETAVGIGRRASGPYFYRLSAGEGGNRRDYSGRFVSVK